MPSTLINAPTGISWGTIPIQGSTSNQQLAEQVNLCWRATHAIDAYCNQVLRATFSTQQVVGPGRRLSVSPSTGVVRVQLDQWPVLAVVNASYTLQNAFPRVYQPIPSNYIDLEYVDATVTGSPIVGGNAVGPTAMIISPNYVSNWWGVAGFRVQAQYVAGFPHAGITANVTVSATTISVDDVTGYAIATTANPIGTTIYDGANTEVVEVTGVTASNATTGSGAYGPGTLTIASPGASFAHAGLTDGLPNCTISTLPAVIEQAAIEMAMGFALLRGSTATTIPRQPGSAQNTGGVNWSVSEAAKEILQPYRRVY